MSSPNWMARLPDHWEVKPLRSVAEITISNVDKLISDDEIPVRLCNYSNVYHNDFITLGLDFMEGTASNDEIAKCKLAVGDVVITKDSESWNDIGVPALVRETAHNLVCGYHLALLRPQDQAISGSFLFRCLQAKPIRSKLELSAKGVTRFGLSKLEIGTTKLPIPPIREQRAIGHQLERETAQLDELVEAKELVLKLLAEKREALVTQAVTRGIDPSVSYRDSGVPWLGDIPVHWEVERARWLFKEREERSLTGDEELLTVSHLTGVTPRSEKQVYMFKAETTEGYKICIEGDLVINTLWAWMGAMGVAPSTGIVSPSYHVYEQVGQRLCPGYVDAMARLATFAQEAKRYSKGVWSSRLRLYPEGFFEMVLPVPPRHEQQKILSYLQNEQCQLDNLEAAVERALVLLKERRAAVISAAVTGQLNLGRAA